MAADLADRVDDVLAHLLRDRLELFVAETVEVGGLVNGSEGGGSSVGPGRDEVGYLLQLGAPPGAASASAERAR